MIDDYHKLDFLEILITTKDLLFKLQISIIFLTI